VGVVGTTALFMMGQGVVGPVLPVFARDFGVGVTLVGLTVGVFGAGRLLMGIPSGFLAQRFGRRWVLVGGPVIATVGGILMALSTSYWQLLAFRFIAGLGGGMQTLGANVYLVDMSTPQTRARYLSVQILSILAGVSVGPLIGGFAADAWGLRVPFYIMAALVGLSGLWAWSQIPETASLARGESPRGRGEAPEARRREGHRPGVTALLTPSFLVVGLFSAAIFLNRQGGRMSILPLFALDKGFTLSEIGLLASLTVIPQFAMVMLSGTLSDRLGRKAVILPATASICLGMTLFIYGNAYWILAASVLLLGLGEGISGSSPSAFAADLAPRGLMGVAMGIFRTFSDLGVVVGPVLLGWVADTSGFSWSLGVSAAVVLLAAVALMAVAREVTGRQRGAISAP